MTYDPKNDWHFDVLKAFHQSLIDDGYPMIDTKRFVMNQLPSIMTELERLKEENKRLVEENEGLKEENEGLKKGDE